MTTTNPTQTIEVQDFAGNVLARVPHDWTDQQIKDHVKKPNLNTKIVSRDEDQVMVGFVEPVFEYRDIETDGSFAVCKFCRIMLTRQSWAIKTPGWEYVCPECKAVFESFFQQELPELQDEF